MGGQVPIRQNPMVAMLYPIVNTKIEVPIIYGKVKVTLAIVSHQYPLELINDKTNYGYCPKAKNANKF